MTILPSSYHPLYRYPQTYLQASYVGNLGAHRRNDLFYIEIQTSFNAIAKISGPWPPVPYFFSHSFFSFPFVFVFANFQLQVVLIDTATPGREGSHGIEEYMNTKLIAFGGL